MVDKVLVSAQGDKEVYNSLKRRAKKNLMSIEALVADIIRRSCVNAKTSKLDDKLDDTLVSIFSRRKYQRKK